MRKKFCLLLLALLQIATPSTAQSTSPLTTTTTTHTVSTTTTSAPISPALGFRTRPANVTVPLGEPAVFFCGVPRTHPNITFTLYGSHRNYSLTCPYGRVEDITQALYGSCDFKSEESLAVWTIKGTSFSDNSTRVVCRQPDNPDAPAAVLHVDDSPSVIGSSYGALIGCAIGGFFGLLLVFGLSYTMLQRSGTHHRCSWEKETKDDLAKIVTKEEKESKSKGMD